MSVSSKFVLQQRHILAGMGRTLALGLKQKVLPGTSELVVPGPVFRDRLEPRPAGLLDAYVRNIGGDPEAYRTTLPPHMWPQFGFHLAARTLESAPYPLLKVINAGARLEIHEPLPVDERLEVTAQLVDVDETDTRVILHQVVHVSTRSAPAGLHGHLSAFVPLARKRGGSGKRDRPLAPEDATEVGRWRATDDAGLDFAKLTGDFNPIHWLGPYARAAGFPRPILHGFATKARTFETLAAADRRPRVLDVRFTRPLVLPCDVGVYVRGDEVYVADRPGGEAYLTGTFETDAEHG